MMGKSFYITLPSNGSMNVFPDNTVTEFRNRLPRPLHLDGEWEVGLIEFTYPYSWYQVCNETSKFYFRELSQHQDWQSCQLLEVKSFSDVQAIQRKTFLPTLLNRRNLLRFDEPNDNDQLYMAAAPNCELKFEGKITQSLGCHDPCIITSTKKYGDYPWLKQNISQLFVYTDIITPHPVGDREVPLLKTMIVSNLPEFGSLVAVTPPMIAYFPVNRNPIDSILISIRDETGQKIPFTSGRTTTVLHFRQRRSSFL